MIGAGIAADPREALQDDQDEYVYVWNSAKQR